MGGLKILAMLAALGLASCAPPPPVYIHPGQEEVEQHFGERLDVRSDRPGLDQPDITFEVAVDPSGQVTEVRFIGPPSPYDARARAALLKYRYKPFTRNGRPVAARFEDRLTLLQVEDLPKQHVAFPAWDGVPVKIVLARTNCLGSCPAYQLTISGDGLVAYNGVTFVAIPGDHMTRLPPAEVQRLLALFKGADFYSLKGEYADSAPDGPATFVTLTIGGRSKRVRDYDGHRMGMPQAVTDLEEAIDTIAGSDRWVKGNGDTLPSLLAEGWKPDSAEGGALLAEATGQAPESLVLAMIAAGARVDAVPPPSHWDYPRSALEGAVTRGSFPMFRALEAKGAARRLPPSVLNGALVIAAEGGNPDMVAAVLALRPPVGFDPGNRRSPLCAAVGSYGLPTQDGASKVERIVKMLMAAGADPNTTSNDRSGGGALFCAETPATAQLMLRSGARLEARDQWGQTPLLATTSEDIALALLAAGADPRARTEAGGTIRSNANLFQWPRVLAELKRRGV